jgi:hypothetical protein
MTPHSFRKAKCCGNCINRSKYKCGGDMWGYDDGDYVCNIHHQDGERSKLKLCVELTHICDDFGFRW